MPIKHILQTALRSVSANKMRSFLTILGIVVGITSIILILSLGESSRKLILAQIQGIGSKTIAVIPGREPTGPSDFAQTFSDSLKVGDLKLLERKENVPLAKNIMPVVFGGESAAYRNETYRMTVMGATDTAVGIFDIKPVQGSFFTEDDIKNRTAVAVIGNKVQVELLGDEDPIGKKIRIKGRNYRVVGVFPKSGQVSLFNFDEMVMVPYTTAQSYIFGIQYFHRFIIEAETEEAILATVEDVKRTLRDSHRISNPEKDDFFVETQADLVSRLDTITTALTILLTSIAAISLLVGGIGIMNIMLVSVTERTREIGLRKAIGATEEDILLQFLTESALLTFLGGKFGIIFGVGLSFIASVLITHFTGIDWEFSIPVTGAAIGAFLSLLIGIIFGIYPARVAARKDPVDALRYE